MLRVPMRASIISQRFARASDVYPSQKNHSFKSRKPALDSLSPDSSRTSYEVDAWLHPRTKRTITNSASTTSPTCVPAKTLSRNVQVHNCAPLHPVHPISSRTRERHLHAGETQFRFHLHSTVPH